MQKLAYLGGIVQVSILYRMVLTLIAWSTQRFSHLDIPTKYHCLTSIMIWKPMDTFFDAIIDVGC